MGWRKTGPVAFLAAVAAMLVAAIEVRGLELDTLSSLVWCVASGAASGAGWALALMRLSRHVAWRPLDRGGGWVLVGVCIAVVAAFVAAISGGMVLGMAELLANGTGWAPLIAAPALFVGAWSLWTGLVVVAVGVLGVARMAQASAFDRRTHALYRRQLWIVALAVVAPLVGVVLAVETVDGRTAGLAAFLPAWIVGVLAVPVLVGLLVAGARADRRLAIAAPLKPASFADPYRAPAPSAAGSRALSPTDLDRIIRGTRLRGRLALGVALVASLVGALWLARGTLAFRLVCVPASRLTDAKCWPSVR